MLTGKSNKTGSLGFFERRKVVLSSIGMLSGTLWNNSNGGSVVATEYTDSNFLFSPYVDNHLICLLSNC